MSHSKVFAYGGAVSRCVETSFWSRDVWCDSAHRANWIFPWGCSKDIWVSVSMVMYMCWESTIFEGTEQFLTPCNIMFLGKLKLKVPWKNLYTDPVLVEVEDVFVVAGPTLGKIFIPPHTCTYSATRCTCMHSHSCLFVCKYVQSHAYLSSSHTTLKIRLCGLDMKHCCAFRVH